MRTHSLRLALAAATLTTAGLTAQAATPATPPQTTPPQTGQTGQGGNRGADLFKDLNLSADQQTKVDALLADMRAQRATMQGPPSDADRQAMQARRATLEAKLKEILTPEQYTKYQRLRPQRGQRPAGQ